MSNTVSEYEHQIRRHERALRDLRTRNGALMEIVQEVAPERIGHDGKTLVGYEAVKPKTPSTFSAKSPDGLRHSPAPCTNCHENWTEPSRRGRMAKLCPDCRSQA